MLIFIISLNPEEALPEHIKQRSLERKLIRLYRHSLPCPLLTGQLYGLCQESSLPDRHAVRQPQEPAFSWRRQGHLLHCWQPRLEGKLRAPLWKADLPMATSSACRDYIFFPRTVQSGKSAMPNSQQAVQEQTRAT